MLNKGPYITESDIWKIYKVRLEDWLSNADMLNKYMLNAYNDAKRENKYWDYFKFLITI